MKKKQIESPINELSENKPTKKINICVVLSVMILIAAIYFYYKDKNIATVNGKPVLRAEYIKNMEKQVGKQTLDQMVTETLILQEGQKKNIKIEKKEIDGEIAKIEEQVKAQNQTLEAALAAEGMKKADLERQIIIQKTIEKLAGSVKEATQEEIDKFITEKKDLIPSDIGKDKVRELVKQQIESEAKKQAMLTWLENLKKSAKIIYQ